MASSTGGLNVHRMDADSGIEGRGSPRPMAMQARVEATLVPAQRMKSTWASPARPRIWGSSSGGYWSRWVCESHKNTGLLSLKRFGPFNLY